MAGRQAYVATAKRVRIQHPEPEVPPDEEGEGKTEVKKHSKGSLDLHKGRFTVDDIHSRFMRGDVEDIIESGRPPYAPDAAAMGPSIEKMIEYTRTRIRQKDKLESDPTYQFIVMVAGFSNTNIKQYWVPPLLDETGRRAILQASGEGGRRGDGGGDSVAAYGGLEADPRRVMGMLSTPAHPYGREEQGPTRSAFDMNSDEGAKRYILERERSADQAVKRRTSRIAMANEGIWMSELEVNGLGRPAPTVIAAIELAHQQVQQFAPRLTGVPLKYFIEGRDVRVNFAQLTAWLIGRSRVAFPTRWYSQKVVDGIENTITLARNWFKNYVVWMGPRRGLVHTRGIDSYPAGIPFFRGTFGTSFEPV